MKTFSKVLIVGLLALLALTSVSFAAVLPNSTTETQGISTTTVIDCTGIVMTSNNYAAEQTNQVLDGAPLAAKEVYGASSYSSQMVALNGKTELVKVVGINDKNQVTTGKNIDVVTDLVYDGANGGFVTGSEDLAQFNAGMSGTKTADVLLCPFGQAKDTTIPPFNEAVSMGSRYDMFYGTVASQAGMTTTAATADVPSQTNYAIEAQGEGSISTYMNLFAQDARGNGTSLISPATTTKIPGSKVTTVVTPGTTTVTKTPAIVICGKVIVPEKTTTVTTDAVTKTVTTKDQTVTTPAKYSPVTPSAQIQYNEKSSAIGQFTFAKTMGYTSGIV